MADDGGMMAKSRLSQNPFAIKTATPTRSLADSTEGKDSRPVLAPPTLKWGNECNMPSAPKVFLRPSPLAAQAERLAVSNQGGVSKTDSEDKTSDESKKDEKSSDSSSMNCFLSGSSKDSENSRPQSGFVFGQNLHERVFGHVTVTKEEPKEDSPESTVPDLSFETAAVQKQNSDQQKNGDVSKDERIAPSSGLDLSSLSNEAAGQPSSSNAKSLTESAEEYQSKQVKRKFSEVTVVTGEEDESNVLQMNCKLFTFDKITSAWQERGRGFLRLNDREVDGNLQSRLVMRTQGSLRVVMNTKVWPAMTVEHPSQKTVRITAMEPEGIKVFLIMASTKDTEQLFSALDWRVTLLKSEEERNNNVGESDLLSQHASTSTQGNTEGTDVFSVCLPPAPSDDVYPSSAKRWRSNGSSDNHVDSNVASRSISSVEDDLSSDSGFPATEDS